MKPLLEYEMIWVKVDPDGRKCEKCKEHIWGNTYELQVRMTEIEFTSTASVQVSLCEPCFTK